MMADELKRNIVSGLQAAGFSADVLETHVHVLDLAGHFYIDVIVSEGKHEEAVRNTMFSLLAKSGPLEASLTVRSDWSIATVGDPAPAYGPGGGIRAAVLISVVLEAGSDTVDVTVAVTKLAESEFDRILGGKTSMKEVARAVVLNALRRGGQNYWNPRSDSYLEVGSGSAPQISRLLRKTASAA